jgi:hypothetical protein
MSEQLKNKQEYYEFKINWRQAHTVSTAVCLRLHDSEHVVVVNQQVAVYILLRLSLHATHKSTQDGRQIGAYLWVGEGVDVYS